MKLSICMIVRNEGSRLARALESVKDVAGEIVITDTGSDDDTIAVAERYGARVNRFEWCDDFAAARNACAEHARGEWILWLDGDERLKPGDADKLRADLEAPRVIAYQMIREEFSAEDQAEPDGEIYLMRLLRRDLPVRFMGRIHEYPTPWPVDLARKTGRLVKGSGARLQHWGYTQDRLPEKCARAARMCALELRDRPGQFYYLVELARSLLVINTEETWVAAGKALREATDIMLAHRDEQRPPSLLAAQLIEQLLALPGQTFADVDELLELGARWFPRHVPIFWATARIRFERAEWSAAESLLRRLIRMIQTGDHDRMTAFDARIHEDAPFNLAVCLVRQARLDEAEAIFTELLPSPRRGEEAAQNIEAIRSLRARFGG